MQLYNLLHEEFGIDRAHLMLLRHAKGRTAQLLAAGASVHEYTAVQDVGGDYDFKHPSKPATRLVAVIVNDLVHAVYNVQGVLAEGLISQIGSPAYRKFCKQVGKPDKKSRRFDLVELRSGSLGARVNGWASPRVAVLRGSGGAQMFEKIAVDARPLPRSAVGSQTTSVATTSTPQAAQVTPDELEELRRLIPRGRFGLDYRREAERRGERKIYVERDGDWLFTIYPGDVHAGQSQIEIALAVPRLAGRQPLEGAVRRWLQAQKESLGGRDGHPRGEPDVEAFRIGLPYAIARDRFLPALRPQLNQLTARWEAAGTAALQPAAVSAVVDAPAPVIPFRSALDHMLLMAKQVCAESGQTRTDIAKDKRFEFSDDQAFRQHVSELLQKQHGLCKLTGLKLQDPLEGADPQFFPSLDRIDSDGHYAAGNLQVVCRFANRWKSDERDEEFRRLLAAVRAGRAGGEPAAG